MILIQAETLPTAWENAVKRTLWEGIAIPTEYDNKNDSPSLDTPIAIRVENPFAEPMIHRCFWGTPEGLLDYVAEIVEGTHDHLVKSLGYTYHDRLAHYPITEHSNRRVCDQLRELVLYLKETPHTRRAQAITWIPGKDSFNDNPPCLQRIWGRVVNNRLNLHVHMRSNDALKAAFMNMFAFVYLQAWIACQLDVKAGYYLHIVDSFHIYGKDITNAEGLIRRMRAPLNKRTWTTEQLLSLLPDNYKTPDCFEDLYKINGG